MVINFECGLLRWLVRVEGGRFVLGNVCHILYVMISYYRKEAKINLLFVSNFFSEESEGVQGISKAIP